jgi:hypothetical protein
MIKGLVYLAILTTVVMISWIAFGIYHNYTTSTINADTGIAIKPIPPQFNKKIIETIKSKKQIDADLNQTRTTTSITPTPTIGPTPSSGIKTTPVASNSAAQL